MDSGFSKHLPYLSGYSIPHRFLTLKYRKDQAASIGEHPITTMQCLFKSKKLEDKTRTRIIERGGV
jgi:hypothetical protein